MKEMNTGRLIVIVAPSGSGKSTLIKRLKARFPSLVESVSYTTRQPREGEKNGVHYHFIEKKKFQEMIKNGDFLEWAEVHSNYYGTSKKSIEKLISSGEFLLFDLDVQGTDSFKNYFKENVYAIFIAPPSIDELEKRLRNRGTDPTEIISLRVQNSKKEMLRKDDFDYCVVNDDLERAYSELEEIVRSILT